MSAGGLLGFLIKTKCPFLWPGVVSAMMVSEATMWIPWEQPKGQGSGWDGEPGSWWHHWATEPTLWPQTSCPCICELTTMVGAVVYYSWGHPNCRNIRNSFPEDLGQWWVGLMWRGKPNFLWGRQKAACPWRGSSMLWDASWWRMEPSLSEQPTLMDWRYRK